MQTRIEEIDGLVVKGLSIHQGKTSDIPEKWEELANVLEGYSVSQDVSYGVCIQMNEDGLDYVAGIDDHLLPDEITAVTVKIPEGRYLVGKVAGGIGQIQDTFRKLFSNQEVTHRPSMSFEKYIGQDLHDIEVWVPIV
ncbi:effector binding domain-containing protein [Viridibacillus sp. FSL R5-0477]|uniref:MerR family transcriptional regulator n=1 Tax=Viridibacillus arenosi FSL R5-213 TaxID=1227360 RepID=W4F0Q8_9BACL|nr:MULTISPECIES: effector binding domain-containing protein [Viridibacillus]ETT86370.1 MerR family transcriptional regulator [Viridibacillus arenosi FSL R5-213]OMC82667.1 MerR family transcriptional regulator [Viridibacillus sp. FSL H7-0596]OMC84740.1 MerR family transcriptional regulator [Viridibacillus sp. FSL H8-0123]OMC91788.1 MerR family transcriptional regulator [Viridibacillus arenosi]